MSPLPLPFSYFFFFLVIKYSYLYILKLGLAVRFTFHLNLSESCRELGILRYYWSWLQLARGLRDICRQLCRRQSCIPSSRPQGRWAALNLSFLAIKWCKRYLCFRITGHVGGPFRKSLVRRAHVEGIHASLANFTCSVPCWLGWSGIGD